MTQFVAKSKFSWELNNAKNVENFHGIRALLEKEQNFTQ